MNNKTQHRNWLLGICGRVTGAALALAVMLVLAILATGSAQAQTYTFSVLHTFTGGTDDGTFPLGLVRDAQGNLYGTTYKGGANNFGTVFKVDTTGKETVLYSFIGYPADGAYPMAGSVMDAQGNLYGTTVGGGANEYFGTVFKIDTTGKETVLHSFFSELNDGIYPKAGLVLDANGNLYGTTTQGGSAGGNGMVFKVDPTGNETVLYNFTGHTDGGDPSGVLVLDA